MSRQKNNKNNPVKICTKCDAILTDDNFPKHIKRRGHYNCRTCYNASRKKYNDKNKNYYSLNPVAYVAHLKQMRDKRNASEEARLAYNAYMRERQKIHRDKLRKLKNESS